jgi:hypothetical protein
MPLIKEAFDSPACVHFLQLAAYFCQRLSGDVEKVFLSSFSADFGRIPNSDLGENVGRISYITPK